MKYRLSYVSNSSSSSFICMGIVVGKIADEYKYLRLNPNEQYVIEGKFLCEGSDLIYLNQEMLDYIISKRTESEYEELDGRSIYRVIATGEYELTLSNDAISDIITHKNENISILSIDIDYYNSDSLAKLKENYE